MILPGNYDSIECIQQLTQSRMIPQHHTPKNNRGAASAQFPGKLHDMITFAEAEGLSYIISFVQSGTAIMVHDPDRLMQILPHFGFCQTQYRSFQRQL